MRAVQQHFNSFRALIIRDLMLRFGRGNLGFLWTILEPMILCSGVLVVWSFIHTPIVHGIPVIDFVFTGYMPLTLWRHSITPAIKMLSRNSNLLYHRPVHHLIIVFARLVLEFLSTTAALALIFLVLLAFDLTEMPQDWGLILAGWLFTAWFHSSLGLIVAALTEAYEWSEKFIQPLQYLALPISGVFFMLDWLPNGFAHLAALNPTVNCFEMFRAGFFGEAVPTHYDPAYLAICSALLTLTGVTLLLRMRTRLQV